MGRRRKNQADNRLPPYVYLAKGRYVYKPWAGGKFGKEIVLCPADAAVSAIWAAYEKAKENGAAERTLQGLFDEYLGSPTYREKSGSTQSDYAKYARQIGEFPRRDGKPFGSTPLNRITAGIIRQYLDKRADAPVLANRHLAFMRLVFAWAYERDKLPKNPAKGVRRNTETPRSLYVTDAMYSAVYEKAGSPWYIRPAMEIAYICRARKSEVLGLTLNDCLPEGLRIRRLKGSKTNVIRWSPRLRAAVDTCRSLDRVVSSTLLFADRNGHPITASGFDTAWQRLMVAHASSGGQRFTFHDLKAKSISDDDGDKQAGSGHKTAAMVAIYDRKPSTADPVK